jgi:hypothetical protein
VTNQILFDRLAYVDRLKAGSFSEQQARAAADALGEALVETVATKADIASVKADIGQLETKFEARFASVEARIAESRVSIINGSWELRSPLAPSAQPSHPLSSNTCPEPKPLATLVLDRDSILSRSVRLVMWQLLPINPNRLGNDWRTTEGRRHRRRGHYHMHHGLAFVA